MAANPAPPMNPRPSAAQILLSDAGLSLAGAALLYPALFLGVAFVVSSENGVAESSRAGALAAASVLILAFVSPLWLTGPHSLIGRMLVFGALAAGVIAGHLAEGIWHRAISTAQAGPLTAIAVGFVLILFSVGWLLRCLGAGRAAQYGAGRWPAGCCWGRFRWRCRSSSTSATGPTAAPRWSGSPGPTRSSPRSKPWTSRAGCAATPAASPTTTPARSSPPNSATARPKPRP